MHSELSRLEQFVEKLLASTAALRQQQADLEARLQEREQMIDELRDTLAAREAERSAVNQRLSRVVGQLQQWEQSLAEDAAPAETAESEDTVETKETAETAKMEETAKMAATAEPGEADEVQPMGAGPRKDVPPGDVPTGPMAVKSGEVAAASETPVQHNLFSMVGGRG